MRLDGSIETIYAVKHKTDYKSRLGGIRDIIVNHSSGDCVGVCIEEPFSQQFSSVKALFPMLGVTVLACEDNKLPWSLINLGSIKKHATGKGNAKKPDMQAAAKARWGVDLSEDEADAAWIAAYALDNKLFD